MLQTDPKRFWKTLNPDQSNSIALCDDSGFPGPDNEVSDILNATFSEKFTIEPLNNLPEVPAFAHPPMNNIIFEPQGIVKVIDSLKNSSYTGIDGITSRY